MTGPYPALWVRIKHRFGPRFPEWFFGWVTACWGAVLLLPADTFDSASWIIFAALAPEKWWGTVALSLGVSRIGALIVNGARKDVTPWIRVVSAGCGFMIWVCISTGFALTGNISTWLAIYPSFAIAEIVNVIRAARDVGEGHAVP
jgi:hypothetical protein